MRIANSAVETRRSVFVKSIVVSTSHLRRGIVCQITDNEARAFQRIILDIRAIDSKTLQDWIDAVWQICVEDKKLREVAKMYETSTIQIRQDMKCALAFISGRYPNLKSDFLHK
ncbi:hypothetical protein [Acinetobacter sp. ANC 4633]|uniref:hypothetical protein n=1 Tax=Acinetobacter sp. ANC 4633 TaxID=2529845 RepID=UPI001D17D9CE|nr:hypothetical protein [Acinetobacter sp. ANC 4633]